MERFNECKSVYTDLIRNSQDEYEEERKTNLAAVVASISQWEDTPLVNISQQFPFFLSDTMYFYFNFYGLSFSLEYVSFKLCLKEIYSVVH